MMTILVMYVMFVFEIESKKYFQLQITVMRKRSAK